MKWNLRFLDLLLLIATGLVAWNLRMTINLKSTIEIFEGSTEIRLQHLEKEADKGGRYTADMAVKDRQLIDSNIAHVQRMFDRHATRTERKIDDMHDHIIRNYGDE